MNRLLCWQFKKSVKIQFYHQKWGTIDSIHTCDV